MKCRILHETSRRMRVHIVRSRMTLAQTDLLEYYLLDLSFVRNVKVYDRTGDAVIEYDRGEQNRTALVEALSLFSYDDPRAAELVPDETGRAMNRIYEEKLIMTVLGKGFRSIFFPAPLNALWAFAKSIRFISEGLRSLVRGKIEVSVLDASAIAVSLIRGDIDTASSIMFLLDVGEILEEWTHRKSVDNLARSMSLRVDKVWCRMQDEEVLVDIRSVQPGDHMIVRTGNVIALDGKVIEGEMTVNQSSMTGESAPVHKSEGGYVYAGTVVEEGACVVEVTRVSGKGKYDQIVHMIEESEKLKSGVETRAFHLADRLVPLSLIGTAVTYLLTRNANRALSFLMVDFSCALKLSMPLSVLSAIREASEAGITVKGGKFLEAAADAQTIVFDKTGTLTHARPRVMHIETFGDLDETECLRIAACLEEHYPHSIANAVVEEAARRGIIHDEMHSQVQYVVAHGISSRIKGQKAIIGSYHFVFEDEKCVLPPGGEEKMASLSDAYSMLYLAIDGVLAAVLCILDPLREEACDVIDQLHRLGLNKVCMMTGDNRHTAAAIAQSLHIDDYYAEVLPADKAAFIQKEHQAGRKVIMIGDGVNDTPALSESDVGVAISDGAAIAREVADIVITADDLYRLITLRILSKRLMQRIHRNYLFIMSFNGLLIGLGAFGVLMPASSALLHNASTVLTGLVSMTDLLPEEEKV